MQYDWGLPADRRDDLHAVMYEFIDIFYVSFSARSSATVPPLKNDLKPDACPAGVKLRKPNESQRRFLKKPTDKLVQCRLMYPNPTSKWACAPHSVLRPGMAD